MGIWNYPSNSKAAADGAQLIIIMVLAVCFQLEIRRSEEWVRRSGAKLNDDDGMATPASWWQWHEQLLITELFWISRSFLINYSSNEMVLNNCRLFKWMYYVERAACGGKNSNLSYQQIKIDGFFAVICRKFHQFQHTTYQKCVQLEPVFWIPIYFFWINIEFRLSNLTIVCWLSNL